MPRKVTFKPESLIFLMFFFLCVLNVPTFLKIFTESDQIPNGSLFTMGHVQQLKSSIPYFTCQYQVEIFM